ncbi:MAG: Gfo/Idh/MocA family oxidoreductase [Polyangiaceae bacterium]|nr:Gfo/Idh/MocA family oxidoreductase [Polyangiaceae bacterium]
MGQKRIRYAVIGQGYFSQAAILPAFKSAPNAELTALFSDDPQKLAELGERYDVEHKLAYDRYDSFLASGAVDAVYIALPNNQHCEYTIRAAKAGVHVLVEKPMATSEDECAQMIQACANANVKLMVAYRLHFEEANLEAIEIAKSGRLGDIRAFNSIFTMQVQEGNSRLRGDLGGGPLNDIGIYCVNAARYIFQDEPMEVAAFSASREDDRRFDEVEEHFGVVMRFPDAKIATCYFGFGAADQARYDVIGTRGALHVDPAYEFVTDLAHELVVDGKSEKRVFKKRDQVAPELIYFSDCIIQNRTPEPSGTEGLADVRIMRAITESARLGRAIAVERVVRRARPDRSQEIHVPPHSMPKLVHARPPSH